MWNHVSRVTVTKTEGIVSTDTSFEDMWASWFFGPLSAKNDPIIKPHPSVKQIANFWGIRTMTGRNMVNAMKTKNTPVARSKPKYMRAFPDGTVLEADWKFPGRSLTPLETLKYVLQNQTTISWTTREGPV